MAKKKKVESRAFPFALDPVTEKNLLLYISTKPHLNLTTAIRDLAHEAAMKIKAESKKGGRQ